jgi:diacylglycerol kinase family enzyme
MMTPMIDPARWFIVVNPASGGGRASRFRPRLTAALERAGLPYQCVESAAPGDATRLFARAADEGYRRLLAVGGDGTFNELVNGLPRAWKCRAAPRRPVRLVAPYRYG